MPQAVLLHVHHFPERMRGSGFNNCTQDSIHLCPAELDLFTLESGVIVPLGQLTERPRADPLNPPSPNASLEAELRTELLLLPGEAVS